MAVNRLKWSYTAPVRATTGRTGRARVLENRAGRYGCLFERRGGKL